MATSELPGGPEAYFAVEALEEDEAVEYEEVAAPTEPVADDFAAPDPGLLVVEESRVVKRHGKVTIVDDYVETDLHGRGFKGVHPNVSDPEQTIRAMAEGSLQGLDAKGVENTIPNHVAYDVFGRADPRVFSAGSEKASKEQALAKMKEIRARAREPKGQAARAATMTGDNQEVARMMKEILSKKENMKKEELLRKKQEEDLAKLAATPEPEVEALPEIPAPEAPMVEAPADFVEVDSTPVEPQVVEDVVPEVIEQAESPALVSA
ncbi:hypothetical protein NDN08_004687 [Rhodosorus marinus]|uniref:Uncharacterized protein n=1 Tax=Rhodosorus marinus TaxID=101924 RepID=A0AAV8UPR6_9RHOD|nr:hypothetical protein NDN08_004687 [Rhodosorus marinus]